MKNKVTVVFIMAFIFIFSGCGFNAPENTNEYAVLIGENYNISDIVKNTDVLVIDAEYFTSDDIAKLKSNGVKEIYSYINIGSIENFRDYYAEYEKYTLAEYDNWPEERWIDVSKKEWQDFVASRVDDLSQKGVDGFFIDNTDVYFLFQNEGIYNGIINILSNIKESNKKIIINGGDTFVKRYFELEKENVLLDGINQEDVYTRYDFDNKKYIKNADEDRGYYTEYLNLAISKGCKAYMLEYATDSAICREATEYASEHKYICYISDNIELKMGN